MEHKSFISGCAGPELSAEERSFLRDTRPCGLILFARNCVSRGQIKRLVDGARECVGGDMLVLVDQEGGRVQRMGPPEWRAYPPARAFASLYANDPGAAIDAAYMLARLMARDLHEVGITVDCAPVLDVPAPGAHDIIGDRAYGTDPDTIIALGRAAAEGLMAGGVLPVIKHMPGHGRARADSHKELPVIDAALEELERTDFRPFAALYDMPLAMTAHVILSALDEDAPASVSAPIMQEVIRNRIGFDGLVMSDDLDMAALTGTLGERTNAVIAAGCDVALHCSGVFEGMTQVADAAPALAGAARRRFEAARARLRTPEAFDEGRALRILDRVLATV